MRCVSAVRSPRSAQRRLCALVAPAIAAAILAAATPALADDVSSPVILQVFESKYRTIENRLPDIFMAGYGVVQTPPPGRADQGNFSVGYDPYDRFDLGSTNSETLYGSETGLRTVVDMSHRAGLSYGVDLVWNHSGFSGKEPEDRAPFIAAGGYPGFNFTMPTDWDGDYHGESAGGDEQMRLAGLVDIAQEKNFSMIRSPVTVGDPKNINAGTTAWAGRLANVPNANNRRFYPDKNQTPIMVYDPHTNTGNIPIYPFNNADPTAGDAVEENATGYLMRNTRWLVQSVGIDMFRLDATKHMPTWVMNYLDRAVYRANTRDLLDGSTRHVFSYGECYDGNWAKLDDYILNSINPQPGVIGGNRDSLDFSLFFAMKDNLEKNGSGNDWRNVTNASFDLSDGNMNGTRGVKFVSSHDNEGAELNNVAHAYMLMLPGNAIVYYNSQEAGTNRLTFPKLGRSDALGGLQSGFDSNGNQVFTDTDKNAVTELVTIRNTHGRGNYHPHQTRGGPNNLLPSYEKELLAYERERSALVLLNNRGDSGYDERTIDTDFDGGTWLVELTGNATNITLDPTNKIPDAIKVNPDKTANVTFMRNRGAGAAATADSDHGYLIYGLPTPKGTLSIGGTSSTLAGWDRNTTGMSLSQKASANATSRVNDVQVVSGDSFSITLNTQKYYVLGQTGNENFRDHHADGDNALLSIDKSFDANGNGTVDFRTGGDYKYGYEQFSTKSPGYTSADNNGTYTQNINATQLSEGYHFISVIAFRHRDASDPGQAVFSDFRKTIYVDRLPPVVAYDSAGSFGGSNANLDFRLKSTDKTANAVHTFLNLPAGLSDQQILAMVNNNNKSDQLDRDIFKRGFSGIPSGNNAITAVTYEVTGRYNIQRLTVNLSTGLGLGVGDITGLGVFTATDVANVANAFEDILYSQNAKFHPGADANGDGRVDNKDLYLLPGIYSAAGATAAATAARDAIVRRGNINSQGGTDHSDITALYAKIAQPYAWYNDLNSDGLVNSGDVDTLVRTILRTEYGDANVDGKVNALDFNAMVTNYGLSGRNWIQGDFNGDGTVNTSDFTALSSHFGFKALPADLPLPGALVPEPSCAGLLGAMALLLRRRRSRIGL